MLTFFKVNEKSDDEESNLREILQRNPGSVPAGDQVMLISREGAFRLRGMDGKQTNMASEQRTELQADIPAGGKAAMGPPVTAEKCCPALAEALSCEGKAKRSGNTGNRPVFL